MPRMRHGLEARPAILRRIIGLDLIINAERARFIALATERVEPAAKRRSGAAGTPRRYRVARSIQALVAGSNSSRAVIL